MSPALLIRQRASITAGTALLSLLVAFLTPIHEGFGEEPQATLHCPDFGEGLAMGLLADPSLNEASGLAASRNQLGVFWSHNDSGDFARLYALNLDGTALGTWTLPVGIPYDCESLAIGPAPDAPGDHIFLADIGNNGLVREKLMVYRISEPALAEAGQQNLPVLRVDSFEVYFPAGIAEDVEAFAVDPVDGSFLFFTKRYSPLSFFLFAPAPIPGKRVNLIEVGTLPIRMVTGADISVHGEMLVLRTYEEVLIFKRGDGESWPEALSRPACPAPLAWEHQGEAIAFLPDGSGYVTVSEGSHQPVIFYPRF
jgi:hypothetical protein